MVSLRTSWNPWDSRFWWSPTSPAGSSLYRSSRVRWELQVLPPLEWRLGTRGPDFLTENSKLIEPVGERRDVLRADLPDDLHSEMEAMAQHAFHALGLRDYARFDLRLSSGGTLFFLEANTTPSLEPLEALALSAQWAGLDYPALVERMLSAALRRYETPHPASGAAPPY